MGEQRDSTGQTDYEEPTPATSAYRLEPTNNNIISNLSGCAPTALISSALPASSLLSSVLPPPALTAFSFAPPSFQSSALGAHHLSESPTLRAAPSGPHNPMRPHPYHVPSLLAQRKTASRPTVLKNSDRYVIFFLHFLCSIISFLYQLMLRTSLEPSDKLQIWFKSIIMTSRMIDRARVDV